MGAGTSRITCAIAAFTVATGLCACTPQRPSSATETTKSVDASASAAATQASVPTSETTDTTSRQDADWEVVSAYLKGLPKGRDVKKGDPERQAILDSVRTTVEDDLDQPVRFVVDHLRTGGGFAALRGRPVQPDGDKINYLKTRYRADVEAGAFDDQVIALLQKRGGHWSVLKCEIGATDWPGSNWLYEYEVPFDLFAWE